MTRPSRSLLPTLLLLAACSGAAGPAPAPSTAGADAAAGPATGAPSAAESRATALYGEAQADRGRRVFQDRCSECHYSSEMRGTQFQFQWERRTVGDLYEHLVETMPEDAPGSLSPAQYLEVVSYILRLNGFPAGQADLRPGPAFEASLEAPAGAASR